MMNTKRQMKILYQIHSTYNPGGMERVLLNKVRYLVEEKGWDVTVVTTDQHDRPPFYPFPEGVKIVDLGVNYSDDNGKPFVKKFFLLFSIFLPTPKAAGFPRSWPLPCSKGKFAHPTGCCAW